MNEENSNFPQGQNKEEVKASQPPESTAKDELMEHILLELRKPRSNVEKILHVLNVFFACLLVIATGFLWRVAEQSLELERLKSKAQLEARFWRVFNESVHLGAKVSIDTSSGDDRTQDARKQGDTNKATSLNTSRSDHRTQIILICRNLSPRPTAVIDVYVRDEKGGYLGGRGYKNQIALPFRVESWGLTQIDFRIERDDEKRMKDIWIKDMEDNEYTVPLGSKWVRAKQKE